MGSSLAAAGRCCAHAAAAHAMPTIAWRLLLPLQSSEGACGIENRRRFTLHGRTGSLAWGSTTGVVLTSLRDCAFGLTSKHRGLQPGEWKHLNLNTYLISAGDQACMRRHATPRIYDRGKPGSASLARSAAVA